ncbi:MAG: succinate--CoA ligase [ADP-forming] subunit beta 2 [Acidimicrobiales bacterium]|nr:MAG: succinate--CoA ligase [ADP-forming] subunit beta 2 [Acidimicrobiales bacterium]
MDLLEYQGKQFFRAFGIPTSDGEVARDPEEAVAAAERLGYPVVVKAQVHTGGRGKAGGIRIASDAEEARRHSEAILGMDIRGHRVEILWLEKASEIAQEWYASFTLDRSAKKHLGMLSARGGVDIEEVAATEPDAIARIHIDPNVGLDADTCAEWVRKAGLEESVMDQTVDVLLKLWRAYTEGDADLVEVNPLILTTDGRVHALDAKVTLDDNASFRHDWAEYEATQRRDEREQMAHERGLQYVGLDGYVGIIANGAGLAMSTLDVVHEVGGEPANFLDIGGGASAEVMAAALEVIDSDEKVRSIFINIFGGITKGEEVAKGIVEALGRVEISAPIVVRLDGTNAEQGREILEPHLSDRLRLAPTMVEAAREAVRLAGVEPRGE